MSKLKTVSFNSRSALHKGHRARLRNKLLSSVTLEPHELLEILLFYSIPRLNTNEIAHTLLNRLRTVSGVFNSSAGKLKEVNCIGKNSMALIMALGEIKRRGDQREKRFFDDIRSLELEQDHSKFERKYNKCMVRVKTLAERVKKEGLYAILITENSGLLLPVGSGSEKETECFAEIFCQTLFGIAVKGAVLFRYTREKDIIPRNMELEKVRSIRSLFAARSIPLYDYFVVSGDCNGMVSDIVGMKGKGYYKFPDRR